MALPRPVDRRAELGVPDPLHPENDSRFPIPWKQGEHVSIVGDTGTGKTTLLTTLLDRREHVVVFRTKLDQRLEPKFGRAYKPITKASEMADNRHDKFVLTPAYDAQAREGFAMLERGWKDGGWCIVLDETWYAERIGLQSAIERNLTQGRSQGVTMVMGMQRPVQVSRFNLSQSTHIFSFRVEGGDVARMREAASIRVVPYINVESPSMIPEHHFVYFNRARQLFAVGQSSTLSRIISLQRRG